MTEEIKQGMTRREVLKKGAIVGGTLVWAVPVVQAVGMSPAMAQAPSEGTCCLRIFMTDPVLVAGGSDPHIEFTWHLKNCGATTISNARGIIDESDDGGTTYSTIGIVNDNKGTLTPGQVSPTVTETRSNPDPGVYRYRMHGTYDCHGSVALPHNVPGSTYLVRGTVAIP